MSETLVDRLRHASRFIDQTEKLADLCRIAADEIERLVHQTGSSGERDAALEEAASWHDEQEANSRAAMASASRHNSGDHIVAMYRYIAQTHANSAERIRAMKGGDGYHHNKCNSCGAPMSGDCPSCAKAWES